jgi:hypothetical protein
MCNTPGQILHKQDPPRGVLFISDENYVNTQHTVGVRDSARIKYKLMGIMVYF